ncbi:uncharacterized protein LOC119744340 [Patiria miniata]|uniref:Uncharacterized protein n=1 Tax=Patiria miniata TaxID=46514 RepID=A0A914BK06_PATMI|nr:uncharacterized protein LOC119744340 [Patiria miniata]
MAKSRWKRWSLELALVLVCCWTGDAVLRSRGQADSEDLPVVRPSIPDAGTVHGHRGYAGTLGVLTAAALVIPAGIISIIYLLYTHICKEGDEDADEMITGGKNEWSEISSNDVMLVNHLWSKTSGWPEEEEDEEMNALLLEGALGQDIQDGMEKLSLISRNGSSGDVTNDSGGFATMNGPDADSITPERETLVEAGKEPVEADRNGDLTTNTVEVHVTADDTYGPKATNHGMEESKRPVVAEQEPARFKQSVNMKVVNQVHVELRLTDLGEDSAPPAVNDGKEKYMSEMQLYLPGFERKTDERGRSFGVDINDNGGWI